MNFDITGLYPMFSAVLMVFVNWLLGSWKSVVENTFDKNLFKKGALKAISIVVSVNLIALAGSLMPELTIISLNGQELTVVATIDMLYTAVIAYYGALNIRKIVTILQIPVTKEVGPEEHR